MFLTVKRIYQSYQSGIEIYGFLTYLYAIAQDSINRTKVELKFWSMDKNDPLYEATINRTKVELKCIKMVWIESGNLTINRTKVELKYFWTVLPGRPNVTCYQSYQSGIEI